MLEKQKPTQIDMRQKNSPKNILIKCGSLWWFENAAVQVWRSEGKAGNCPQFLPASRETEYVCCFSPHVWWASWPLSFLVFSCLLSYQHREAWIAEAYCLILSTQALNPGPHACAARTLPMRHLISNMSNMSRG